MSKKNKNTNQNGDESIKDETQTRSSNTNEGNKHSNKNKTSRNKSGNSKGQGNKGKGSLIGSAALQTNENIIKNAGSIPYFTALGRKLGLGNVNPFEEYVKYSETRFPGIMVLNYISGPGIAAGHDDPVNIAADSVYSYNRHMNSGAANYDSNDQMVYMLGAAELYAYWAFAVRALGLLRIYDTTNLYLPKALVEAAGFDFDDLKENQTRLRGDLNTYAALISAYAVPDVFPYFGRMVTMTSKVFADRDVLKPQMYLFKPMVSRLYSEATSDKGAELIPELIPNKITVAQWSERMSEMINAFRRSEDCGIISGDILKAYGRSGCVTMPVVDENYTVIPEYDEDWLTQIHNARILTHHNDITAAEIQTFKIYSDVDSGLVKYIPIHRSLNCGQLPFLVDQRKSEPEPKDNMVATRLIPNVTYGIALVENQRVWAIQSAGTEIVLSAEVYTLDDQGEITEASVFHSTITDSDTTYSALTRASHFSKFNWAPLVWEVYTEDLLTANPKYVVEGIIGEIANYALLSGQNINELHRAELLEAFRIPYEGSY